MRNLGKPLRLALASMLLASPIAPAAAQPGQAADPIIWQGSPQGGTVVHVASRVPFPSELGGFTREKLSQVGPEDVAATYRNKDGATETLATVYLFRPASLPEHRLKGSVLSFGELNPTAFLWSAGPFAIKGTVPLHGWKGVFKTGIGPDTVMDYLYFVELGRWTVKVRATVTGIKEPAQEARIDAFVAALPWAQVLAANGECGGRACSAPAFDSFRHHYMETMLAPLLAGKMQFKPKDEAKLPSAGQLEVGIFGKVEVRRSQEGDLVYVAAVPDFFTYRLIRLPPPITRLFTEGFGALSIDKPVHAIVVKVGEAGLMPRLYNGEPSLEAFGKALDQLAMQEMPGAFVSAADFAKTLED